MLITGKTPISSLTAIKLDIFNGFFSSFHLSLKKVNFARVFFQKI